MDRIKISSDGVYVSRPGFDVNTASEFNLGMYPNMRPMYPALSNTVTIGAGAYQDFFVSNPIGKIPYVLLMATSGEAPSRNTYCAEVSPPYNSVRIRNISGPTRTIRFSVMVDNNT